MNSPPQASPQTDLKFSSECPGQHRSRPLPIVLFLGTAILDDGASRTADAVQPLQLHPAKLRRRLVEARGEKVI